MCFLMIAFLQELQDEPDRIKVMLFYFWEQI